MQPGRPTRDRGRLAWPRQVVLAGALPASLAACGATKPPAPPPTPPPAPLIAHGAALPPPVPTTASTRATLKLDSTWLHCHETFVVGAGDAAAEVSRFAGLCAAATKMRRVAPFAGEQAASAKPQTFRWKAQAGHCYRAYGVGGAGIKNLDLLVVDGGGAALGQDGSDDATPVVLDAGSICFKQDDDAAVVVSVGDGSGAFAVEVWGD